MIQLELQQFQADFSRYIEQVAQGEGIILCRDQQPIAEIKPLAQKSSAAKMRPLGMAKNLIEILPGAFDPLPPDVLAAFYGEEE
jgi:antitoxin (DNA-binding transcriptional repressor) of toxin-antitoxin stability system